MTQRIGWGCEWFPGRSLGRAGLLLSLFPSLVAVWGAPLFSEAEVRIVPGSERRATVHLSRASAARLRFRARLDAPQHGGMLAALHLRVNGDLVGIEALIERPDTVAHAGREGVPTAPRGRWLLYYAPSFAPLPADYKYYPQNLPDNDPFTFCLDVGSLLQVGENTISFAHVRSDADSRPIVVADAALEVLSADDLLALEAERSAAEAEAMRATRLRLYSDVPATDDTADMLATMRGMRMATWAYWNSGDLNEFPSPEAAAERARELKSLGATVAIVRGRHFRLHYLDETERLLRYYETAATACRAVGLRCFAHFDFVLAWQAGFPFLRAHDQVPQRSLYDGTPTRWLCCNNPALREAHIRYVEEIARRGIEGFMLDEISFIFKSHLHCGCEHCRGRFEAKTGMRLPEWNDPAVIGNPASPLWRLWQEWQMQTLVAFRAEIVARVRRIRPGALVLTYSTNIYYPTRATDSVMENARVCFAGTEGTNLSYGGACNIYAQHRIALAFTSRYGRPAWAQYPVGSTEERIFASLYLAPVTGNAPWGWMRRTDEPSMAPAFTWPGMAESMEWGTPLGDTGVLLSTVNRYGPPARTQLHALETSGWIQALGMQGIQFSPLVGKYLQADDLRPYRVLVAADCLMLPEPTAAAVADYVASGGSLIVTGVPGRYDALSYPLGKASLLRRVGIRSVHEVDQVAWERKQQVLLNTVEREIHLENGLLPALARQLRLPATYRFDLDLAVGVEPSVWARFADGAPAIQAWPWGAGRVIYLGFTPGQASLQPRCSKTTVVDAWHDPAVHALVRAVILEAGGGAPVRVDGDGVLSSSWQSGNRLWVRLVNVSGLRQLPVGQPLGNLIPEYPSLGLLRVRLSVPVAADAQLVTPDQEQEVPLRCGQDAGGTFVDIPAGAFSRFAFLRLEVRP